MNLAFGLIAVVILATAAVAVSLSKLVHAALLLVVTWFGIAAFFLWAGAEFIAFAQVLIYAGAISIVVLFAVLLTPPLSNLPARSSGAVRRGVAALGIGVAVATAMTYAILRTPLALSSTTAQPAASVKDLGVQLMGPHIAAVLIVGLILTAALIGAVVIAASPVNPEDEEAP